MKKLFSTIAGVLLISLVISQTTTSIERDFKYTKVDNKTFEVLVFEGDKLVEEGLLVNGKREGVWKSYNTNGTLQTEVTFNEGQKNGVWIIYDNGNFKYVLNYKDNKLLEGRDLLVSQ